MKSSTLRYSGIAVLALGGLYAVASFDGKVDSVHFYGSLKSGNKVDFGRAPIGVRMVGWTNEPERGGTVSTSGWDIDEPNQWDSAWTYSQNRIHQKARNFESSGDFQSALGRYQLLWQGPGMAAFVKDREEVFKLSAGKDNPALQQYLRARYLIEFGERKRGFELMNSIQNPPKYLKPHVLYAQAGNVQGGREAVANAYIEAYWADRKAPRAESALIMAARSLLQEGSQSNPSSVQISKADRILNRLLSEFPRTRFRQNATGWLGRVALLRSEYALASKHYTAQTKSPKTEEAWMAYSSLADLSRATGRADKAALYLLQQFNLKSRSKFHLQGAQALAQVFEGLNSEQAKAVQLAIRQDPSLLDAYIGFRIEHTELDPAQESNLMTFATSALQEMKSPPASLTSRVAQINYNAGRYVSARLLAQKSLRLRTDSEDKARAQYVLAGSLARLGQPKEAIREGERLLQPTTPGYLRQGAAEFLALQHERHGDPLRALDLYIGLGYQYDAAFLADARLTPTQLKRFLSRSPKYQPRSLRSMEAYGHDYGDINDGSPSRDALQYTLGMRYLRQENYTQARRAFLKLPRETRTNWGMLAKNRKEMLNSDGSLGWDRAPKVVDPIDIVAKLENLTRLSKSSKSADARAQAIYDKAAFIYKERNLLFYSPSIWQGQRAFAFDYFWSEAINGPADKAALDRHLNEHECLAQSMRLCEEIVSKYPKSKVMPKALYTAAISAERLSNLNTTWRTRGEPLLQKAINRLDRLIKDYPGDALAKPAAKYKKEFAKQLAKPDYR